MTAGLAQRIAAGIAVLVPPPVRDLARSLAETSDAIAVLFYGSNLRSGSLDGVLDFYVLLPGPPERVLWPRVSFHEFSADGVPLRAKVATMTLAKFAQAASGRLLDTTIWARFVQPSALAWARDLAAEREVVAALSAATITAARLAAVLGPDRGVEADYWAALFRATYRAELRVERGGREATILDANRAHFDGLLPLAWAEAGIACEREGTMLQPLLDRAPRAALLRRWRLRQRGGKPLNLARLLRAAFTFDGAARYAAWKIERHSGVRVPLTPWRERHPIIAAPAILWTFWRSCQRANRG
ncbi:MAG: hypothetical protein ABIT04_10450 [Novosphingobium sp.]